MKKVLVLGAGLVSGPLVRYLLDRGDIQVTVATRRFERAQAQIAGRERGVAVALDAEDLDGLDRSVASADLCISLLPPAFHTRVAELALAHGRHFLTTSYVTDGMRVFDDAARAAGLTFLNEVGLDPGIDHMSALRIVSGLRERGGAVTSFRSYCGGLPAPEACDNPWGYKFSWSPRGVVLAGRNAARYRERGREVSLPGEQLFSRHWLVTVPGFGELEAYFNRDAVPYSDMYGLGDADCFFRATLRYVGWCFAMSKLVELGYLSLDALAAPLPSTYAELTRRLAGFADGADLRAELARLLDIDMNSDPLVRMEWLGLLGDDPVAWGGDETPLDALAAKMLQKMNFAEGERDLCVMHHEIEGGLPGGRHERITSTLIAYGEPGGDSAMSRTVGLPAAIAAAMILDGRIGDSGVLVPVTPSIYEPILDELAASAGVIFTERTHEI